MKLNEMYNYIEDNNIELICKDLKKLNASYIKENNFECILLNENIKNECKLKCVLMEEIAHREVGVIPTNIFQNDYYNKLERSKNEFKALKYSSNEIIPFNIFKQYIKQDMTKFEVSEELGITEEFLERAYPILKEKLENGR